MKTDTRGFHGNGKLYTAAGLVLCGRSTAVEGFSTEQFSLCGKATAGEGRRVTPYHIVSSRLKTSPNWRTINAKSMLEKVMPQYEIHTKLSPQHAHKSTRKVMRLRIFTKCIPSPRPPTKRFPVGGGGWQESYSRVPVGSAGFLIYIVV